MTVFKPGDRVHLKGHAHTPATTGTVITETLAAAHVMWDDNHTTTPHHPQHLELVGEPMEADPRIEAAAEAIEAVTYSDVTGALAEECATAALAAADNAATITTVEELDALPVGSVVLSDVYRYSLTYPNYTVSFQKLYDDSWHRGGRASDTHPSVIIPARVIHWGTE
ncbi:hypothetical protein [Paeniglutamicibacter gangotriensis]|uniref:Uncharacterized protein n=1 Tax=Paeniglutamicibacter gangotriensis Lz1y TaxID=1276920 RepID=M7MTK9_9MICC|nr:hypothetical protein [Paeniglutamicibacter gangotriensis]EMQ98366.1 hypothetical protein ADIAG_02385 [Paeniglutamicibacter gangotriensis Lz1y]